MDRPLIAANGRKLQRLRALVARLTDKDAMLPPGKDGTVAVALAHLAFRDERARWRWAVSYSFFANPFS